MGTSLRFYALEQDGRFRRLPAKRFENFLLRDEAFPEYANCTLRYALVYLETEQRVPKEVRVVEFNVVHVGTDGRRDQAKFMEQMRLSVDSMPEWASSNEDHPRGRDRFAKKRLDHEYHWTPSDEQFAALRELIWSK